MFNLFWRPLLNQYALHFDVFQVYILSHNAIIICIIIILGEGEEGGEKR